MTCVFESETIRFVRVTEELIEDYLCMINDIEHVARYFDSDPEPYTEEQERNWVRSMLENHAVVFSMLEKTTGDYIGNIELMDVRDGVGELGIAITACKQNRGLGTESVSALTNYGFDRLGLQRVFLRTNLWNARAIRVYEKCGFREYRRTDEKVFMERRRTDLN